MAKEWSLTGDKLMAVWQKRPVKELCITLALLIVYRQMIKIPLPFVDTGELELANLSFFRSEEISIAALGIMPFASAYMLVEIFSLIFPFLKKYRGGDYCGRKILKNYAIVLTLILSVIQGALILHSLTGMRSPSGLPILAIASNLQFIAVLATLVGSVFVLLFVAELITLYGIGNGISLLIFSGICSTILPRISNFFLQTNEISQNFFYLLHFLVVLLFSIAVIFLSVFFSIFLVKTAYPLSLTHRLDSSSTNYLALNFCPSGKEAAIFASSLMMLPATLSSFSDRFEASGFWFSPGSLTYSLSFCICIVLLNYLFGWLFLSPGKRFATLQHWGWSMADTQSFSVAGIRKKFLFINLPWTIFFCIILMLPYWVITGFNLFLLFDGLSLIAAAVISLDIFSHCKLWKANVYEKTYKIAEFHDIYYATMIRNHLASENITFCLQGYYHRHLLYFFGPYIPIDLMVPAAETERVTEIISRYYGGLGLVHVR